MKVGIVPSLSHARRAARKSGQVFRMRQGQADMYPKPEPVNPNTPDQAATRAAWKRGKQGWTQLSSETQSAWNRAGERLHSVFELQLGRRSPEPLTGHRLFMQCATNRMMLGLELPEAAPDHLPPPALEAVEVLPSAGPAEFRLRLIHGLSADAGLHVLVSLSPATLRNSRKPQRRQARQIRGWGEASTAPLPESGGEAVFSGARFAVEPGRRFGVWIRILRASDGLAGPEFFADLIRPEADPPELKSAEESGKSGSAEYEVSTMTEQNENPGPDAAVEPAISVIITAYNRRALLPRALESLRRQTVEQWEAVVVDDGSRDGTRELVADFVELDRRIRYVYQENGGLSSARNTGLRAARASLMTFLDSDDEYRPHHLESRLRFFAENPEVELIHGGLEIVGGPDWVPDRFDPTRRILLADCFVGGTFVMRRHVFEALGGFRKPDYGDDYDFMTRALEQNYRVARLDEPTYVYHRETPDGMCNLMAEQCKG